MPAKKFTVTHPDGTVSKRSSQSAEYAFTVVVHPADPKAVAEAKRHQAAEDRRKSAKLVEAADRAEFGLRSRALGATITYTDTDLSGYDWVLKGTEYNYHGRTLHEITTRGSKDGYTETLASYQERFNVTARADLIDRLSSHLAKANEREGEENPWIVVPVREYLIGEALHRAQALLHAAQNAELDADTLDSGDLSPLRAKDREYTVVRWSRSRELAAKAADGEFTFYATSGRKVTVEPVD